MTAVFTPLEQVEWRRTKIHKISEHGPEADHVWKYEFELPRPLADWDVFAVWERPRVLSMEQHLTRDDILFDVGTEQGWCNLIYADIVGPGNMVLIEPTPEFWPNIAGTWHMNYATPPKACYDGLFSSVTNDSRLGPFCYFPQASYTGKLIDRNKYQYIHEHEATTREMRLDDFVDRSRIVPTALTIDVEGAESLVLRGAEATLADHHPLVWVSIHPDLMERDYGTEPEELHAFMADLGYTGEHLATDHEQHWLFA